MADLTGPNPDEINGLDAHDAPVTAKPVLVGGYASAAAPSAVSGDGDAVNGWFLRSGAMATVLTAAGALIGGDATNGLDVDVTRLPALVAGTANIGDVDVLTVPADPFGANADAASATGSISAKLRFIAATGIPITGTVTVASHAVTNAGTFVVQENGAALTALQLIDDTVVVLGTDTYTEATSKGLVIGAVRRDADTTLVNTTNEYGPLQMDANGRLKVEAFSGETLPVSLATLPALVAGSANIGDVDVLTVPADPFGVNADAASATGSISAKLRFIAATGIPITGTVTVGSHAVTNAGTFAVQESGAALTALQLIDDTVVVLGTDTYTEATTKGLTIGAVRRDADTTLVGTTNEIGPLQMDANGRLKVEAFSGETLPVSLASVPSHAVTNAGTFAVQVDGNALTSLQLIDDAIHTDDQARSKSMLIGAVLDDTSPTAITENQAGYLRMSTRRALLVEGVASGTALAVSAAIGSPVNVQIGNATLAAGVIDETGASAVDALAIGGGTPNDSVDSGNPVKIGMQARTSFPTAVANADRVNATADSFGRQLTSHIDPALHVSKAFNATTTQTGTDVWTPGSGKRIAVTSLIIGTYGATAARVILWFGDNADTTYSAGTDQVLFAASFAPSATVKPGATIAFAHPVFCTTADRELHITTDAGISIDVVVHGYEY